MKLCSDFKVVILRARSAAQSLEIKPHHPAGLASGLNLPGLDFQYRILVLRFRQTVKGLSHLGIRLRPERRVIQPGPLQRTPSVIGSVVNVDDLQVRLQQFDSGKNAVAVQAIRIKRIGMKIGRCHESNAIFKQGGQQTVKNHGIRNVCHVKFIEANQPITPGNTFTQLVERVCRALQILQFPMHLPHELMKVQADFALERNGAEKAVHEKALTPPHPSVHVNPTRNIRPVDQFLEGIRALPLKRRPLGRAALQSIDCAQLRWIADVAARTQFSLVGREHQTCHAAAAGPPQGG